MKPPTKYKVEQASDLPTPCWLWQGALDFHGYGHTGRRTEDGTLKNWRVHRLMYHCMVGPIPPTMVIDHLCCNRHCINPAHLEAITAKENTARGRVGEFFRNRERCGQGHEYTEENTMWVIGKWNNSERRCRKCESNKYFKLKEQNPAKIKEYRDRCEAKRRANPQERAKRALDARLGRARRKAARQLLLNQLRPLDAQPKPADDATPL